MGTSRSFDKLGCRIRRVPSLNYFNYFTEIEDAFVRRRGKHLLLSPIDWAMIETWQERGIPLHVVLRAIASVFDNFDKNPRPRTIKSLIFCREEVEAQFAEWSAGRVGSNPDAEEPKSDPVISRETILGHIESASVALAKAEVPGLEENIERATARLAQLAEELTDDLELIDRSLLDIEKFLDEALLSKSESVHLKQVEKEVSSQLKEYRSKMDKEAYDQTHRLMVLKRLREDHGIPRLGLFYV